MNYFLTFCLLICASAAWAANTASNFGGVGIDGAPLADGRIVVKQLVTGGPAHVAGIKAGDVIIQIDGTATAGADFRKMVDTRLRGKAGTPVYLRVERSGEPKPLGFKLIRRQLIVPAGGTK